MEDNINGSVQEDELVSVNEQTEDSTDKEPENKDVQTVSEDKPVNTETEEKSSFLSDFLEIFEVVIISVFTVLLVFKFIARPVTVEGKSMYPTLDDADKLIMRTIGYSPEQGDIIIVDNHESHTYVKGTEEITIGPGLEKRIIKRVIALGGQTVDIDFETGKVTVDGEELKEDYIADLTHLNPGAFDYPVKVPEGYVFAMGDNRNNSTDSRDSHVGLINEEDIMGEAIMRFYPFDKFGLV